MTWHQSLQKSLVVFGLIVCVTTHASIEDKQQYLSFKALRGQCGYINFKIKNNISIEHLELHLVKYDSSNPQSPQTQLSLVQLDKLPQKIVGAQFDDAGNKKNAEYRAYVIHNDPISHKKSGKYFSSIFDYDPAPYGSCSQKKTSSSAVPVISLSTHNGLSKAQIAGIAGGAALGAIIIGGAIAGAVILSKNKSQQKKTGQTGNESIAQIRQSLSPQSISGISEKAPSSSQPPSSSRASTSSVGTSINIPEPAPAPATPLAPVASAPEQPAASSGTSWWDYFPTWMGGTPAEPTQPAPTADPEAVKKTGGWWLW